jgi:hypothetical protein
MTAATPRYTTLITIKPFTNLSIERASYSLFQLYRLK